VIPKRILACTDFSESSVPARILAILFAKAFNAELVLFHVVNSRFFGYPAFTDRMPLDMASVQKNIEEGVQEELDLLINDARRDLNNVTANSRVGAPAEEIVRYADENEIDLIIMGTHGWTGIRHLILGSTAENVLRTAKCPVLTVRSEEK
jgi:universal stress protein A